MTISLKVAVGFTLVVLAWFCGQTHSVLPRMNEYTPAVLKPIFDSMRLYGNEKKNEDNKTARWNQYLVVLMASHNEIINQQPVNVNDKNSKQKLENHFKERLKFLLNQNKHQLPEFNPKRPLHGETNYIHNNMIDPMLNAFKQKYGDKEVPIILMYSYYIPCADVPNLGYSCSEELGVFATNNWNKFGLLVSYSTTYVGRGNSKGTDVSTAQRFLQLAGIPTFRYQSSDTELIPDNAVSDANNKNRWRSATFLPVFFDCLLNNIVDDCLSDRQKDKRAIIAFFVNNAAYQCFRDKDYRWRRKRQVNITECFSEYFENNMGSDCKLCAGVCAASKKSITQTCLSDAFDKTLVPGAPLETFDPFSDAWRVTGDITLTKIFPDSPQNRTSRGHRKYFCKDPSLSLESLCSVSACNGTSPKPGFFRRLFSYCCTCFRAQSTPPSAL